LTSAARVTIEVAAGVLQRATGQALIAQRPASKHAGGEWEFPGGKLEPGESPRAGLERELREELGIQVLEAESLMAYSHRYPDLEVHLHVFRVTRWSGEPAGLEDQPLRWVAVEQLLQAGLLPADEPIVQALARLSKS
jgi:8-oxo-dGTP diphosphatase